MHLDIRERFRAEQRRQELEEYFAFRRMEMMQLFEFALSIDEASYQEEMCDRN
jgi:hypothetical protein